MNQAQALCFYLIRAVEQSDANASLLPHEERQWANQSASGEQTLGLDGLGAPEQAFLLKRAQLLFTQLQSRHPGLRHIERLDFWQSRLAWILPAAAFLLGIFSNGLGASQRINILAFPLLGMLVWNMLVYLILILSKIRQLADGAGYQAPAPVLRGFVADIFASERLWLARIKRLCAPPPSAPTPPHTSELYLALLRFCGDWFRFAAPLTTQRIAFMLHLCAALLALGALSGMYARALGLEYLAGWESTFLDQHAVSAMLQVFLGPASALTGIPIATVGELAAMRWNLGDTGQAQAGVNAAPWIHLYAASVGVFIVFPRALLACLAWLKARRLTRRFPLPDADDPYLRRLFAALQTKGKLLRITPYSCQTSSAVQQALQTVLRFAMGESLQIESDTPIPYGGEDEFLETMDSTLRLAPRFPHLHIVWFSLAATPESENHGTLVAGIQSCIARHNFDCRLLVILDESAYRQRLANQAGADKRLTERRENWTAMLNQFHVPILPLDLEQAEPRQAAAQICQILETGHTGQLHRP